MPWSSRSTPPGSSLKACPSRPAGPFAFASALTGRSLLVCLAAAVCATGCERKPAGPVPQRARVYVNLDRLLDAHPLWEDVKALDRQVGFLEAYKPTMRVAELRNPVPRGAVAAPTSGSNVAALRRRIVERMAEVKAARLAVLLRQKEEMERAALDEIEADVSRFASDLDAGIVGRWSDLAEEYDHRIAALRARAEAARAQVRLLDTMVPEAPTADAVLLRNRASLKEYRTQLEAERNRWLAEADELEMTWNSRVSAIGDDRNARVAAYREARRDAALAASEKRFAELVSALNRDVDASRSALLESLASAGSVSAGGRKGAEQAWLAPPPAPKPLPAPGLAPALGRLRSHRASLRRTIYLNTRSIVLAAAARRNVEVDFSDAPGLPDETLSFRPVVASAGTSMPAPAVDGGKR